MVLRSLLPTRLGLRGPGLRAYALQAAPCSTAASSAASEEEDPVDFDTLFLEGARAVQPDVAAERVLKFLRVRPKTVERVLAKEGETPFVLPSKVVLAPEFVRRLTPLVHWSFRQYDAEAPKEPPVVEATATDAVASTEREVAADAVFAVLQPHTNMAKTAVWRHYFQRQFFLSGAPLRAYLHAFKRHQDPVMETRGSSATEDGEDDGEGDEDDALGDVDEDAEAKTPSTPKSKSKSGRKRVDKTKEKFEALIQSTTWDWVPAYLAAGLVKEYCLCGRFLEAIEAYAVLPLHDTARQQVAQLLQDYEQFPAVLYLYEVHRAMGSKVGPLDVYPELNALKHVGLMEDLHARFQELPVQEQSRAELQALVDN